MTRLKLGVLISGRGSNLQALIAACTEISYPAEIVLVLANKPDAIGLEHAREAGAAPVQLRAAHHDPIPKGRDGAAEAVVRLGIALC